MKKLCLITILTAGILTGCGNTNDGLKGKWKATCEVQNEWIVPLGTADAYYHRVKEKDRKQEIYIIDLDNNRWRKEEQTDWFEGAKELEKNVVTIWEPPAAWMPGDKRTINFFDGVYEHDRFSMDSRDRPHLGKCSTERMQSHSTS